jgi:hypothetical protein
VGQAWLTAVLEKEFPARQLVQLLRLRLRAGCSRTDRRKRHLLARLLHSWDSYLSLVRECNKLHIGQRRQGSGDCN